jgi:hypothetical protein
MTPIALRLTALRTTALRLAVLRLPVVRSPCLDGPCRRCCWRPLSGLMRSRLGAGSSVTPVSRRTARPPPRGRCAGCDRDRQRRGADAPACAPATVAYVRGATAGTAHSKTGTFRSSRCWCSASTRRADYSRRVQRSISRYSRSRSARREWPLTQRRPRPLLNSLRQAGLSLMRLRRRQAPVRLSSGMYWLQSR